MCNAVLGIRSLLFMVKLNITGGFFSCNKRIAIFAVFTILFSLLTPPPAEARKRRIRKQIHIRDIRYDVKNVFDPSVPGENYWPYRVANFLHIRTRAQVIRRELLVRSGESTNEELLEESERSLRALPFIRDAKIIEIPAQLSGKVPSSGQWVDLHVRTRDSWTTQPQVNFGSEGGQNKYSAGILEENFLGYGKSVSYFYSSDQDGISNQFSYSDPQLFNTRWKLTSSLENTSTGNKQSLTLTRPFFSRETRTSGGLGVNRSRALQKVFENGTEISRYDRDHFDVSPSFGVRLNEDLDNIHRLNLQYNYNEDVFHPQATTKPGTLPTNKAFSGPVLTYSFDQSDFIKETFVDKAERVEDINLGHQFNIGSGYYGQGMGGSINAAPFSASHSFGFGGKGDWFGLATYGTAGRYTLYNNDEGGGKVAHTLYFLNFNYYRHLLPEFPLTGVAHFESAYLQHADTQNLLTLGGDRGLRGYKVNAFSGDKSMLLNLESRFFVPREVLHLAFLGGAIFMDAGEVQPQGLGFTTKDIHANVGAGFRFALTRSTEGTVYRVDFAYALGPLQDDNRWIISITSGQGFKRTGNSYSTYGNGVP